MTTGFAMAQDSRILFLTPLPDRIGATDTQPLPTTARMSATSASTQMPGRLASAQISAVGDRPAITNFTAGSSSRMRGSTSSAKCSTASAFGG
jgi:hypothetical protein